MIVMHPPADRRCQIYAERDGLERCTNEGTHWEKWGGEADDFYSWECGGDHVISAVAVASDAEAGIDA